MSAGIEEKDRHIFPRWRTFKAAGQLGELSSRTASGGNDLSIVDAFLTKQLADLSSVSSLWRTLDTLGTAIVANDKPAIDELTKLTLGNTSTPVFATHIFRDVYKVGPVLDADVAEVAEARVSHKRINESRKRIRFDPFDAIGWLELARAYTIAGVDKKAKDAIAVARYLAPENRFILRSASRFFIHTGDLEKAHRVLAGSAYIKYDPWLLASEIAISSALGKTSNHLRRARDYLTGSTPAREVTELAAALGTVEAENGKARIARKLLRISLEGANENSIAQINWLQRSDLGIEIDTSHVRPPLLHESDAWLTYYKAEWKAAKRESLLWLQDQPFASAPALLSSYILSEILGEFTDAERVLKAALIANPTETLLLNNLALPNSARTR